MGQLPPEALGGAPPSDATVEDTHMHELLRAARLLLSRGLSPPWPATFVMLGNRLDAARAMKCVDLGAGRVYSEVLAGGWGFERFGQMAQEAVQELPSPFTEGAEVLVISSFQDSWRPGTVTRRYQLSDEASGELVDVIDVRCKQHSLERVHISTFGSGIALRFHCASHSRALRWLSDADGGLAKCGGPAAHGTY